MIKIEKTKIRKEKPSTNKLGFGRYFTDHMLLMEYDTEKGWHDLRIVPYGPLETYPGTTVFHYAQCIFEGLKAYKDAETGSVRLFRPRDNLKRLNRSCERMCMPQFDEDTVFEGLIELVKLDSDWIPTDPGTSLYIRPVVFGSESFLGVRMSRKYIFCIMLSPVAAYYEHGLHPTKIYIEDKYVRACIGGTGDVKCGANYAISLKAGEEAHAKGFDQVLWLDARTRKGIEEVGSMNIFFVIGDEVITPKLVGSVLPGITRDSAIKLLRARGYNVSERVITVDELIEAAKNGTLKESFGTGTAAVISPVGQFTYLGETYKVGDTQSVMGPITSMLYDTLTGIQADKVPDEFNWLVRL